MNYTISGIYLKYMNYAKTSKKVIKVIFSIVHYFDNTLQSILTN